MSQAGILNTVSNSPLPPTIPTSFLTDNGTAIPATNVLSITGLTSTDNNSNGIETDANPNLSKFLHVKLTNRAVGSVTTNDGSTVTLISLPLGATPGTYAIYGSIAGFSVGNDAGGGYFYEGVVRTTGVVAVELGGEFTNFKEDTTFQSAFVQVTSSGNNFIVEVTGIVGQVIDWTGILNFVFVS